MAQTLDARFQIKDDGSVVLRNISKELYKVKSNTKDASKAADAFGDTSVGATKRARKGARGVKRHPCRHRASV